MLGISPGSPAEYASLRVGDALISCGGRRFESIDDLRDALDQATSSVIRLQFLRRGQRNEREVTVRLVQGVAA